MIIIFWEMTPRGSYKKSYTEHCYLLKYSLRCITNGTSNIADNPDLSSTIAIKTHIKIYIKIPIEIHMG
jgi:hypothetical protein